MDSDLDSYATINTEIPRINPDWPKLISWKVFQIFSKKKTREMQEVCQLGIVLQKTCQKSAPPFASVNTPECKHGPAQGTLCSQKFILISHSLSSVNATKEIPSLFRIYALHILVNLSFVVSLCNKEVNPLEDVLETVLKNLLRLKGSKENKYDLVIFLNCCPNLELKM